MLHIALCNDKGGARGGPNAAAEFMFRRRWLLWRYRCVGWVAEPTHPLALLGTDPERASAHFGGVIRFTTSIVGLRLVGDLVTVNFHVVNYEL
jgi:hypothetical protein